MTLCATQDQATASWTGQGRSRIELEANHAHAGQEQMSLRLLETRSPNIMGDRSENPQTLMYNSIQDAGHFEMYIGYVHWVQSSSNKC